MASSTVGQDFGVLETERYIPLIVLGSISSLLSIFGSTCVIYMSSKKLHKIMHRLVFLLSISDIMASLAALFMPYMVPSFMGLLGAVGNVASCSAAGFFLSLGVMMACCYNFYLSGYYLATVRKNWKEYDFRKPFEIAGHALALLVPLAISLIAATTGSMNPSPLANNLCSYTTWPWECFHNDDIPCERSSPELVTAVTISRATFTMVLTTISFIFTFTVWWTVRATLKKSDSYRFAGSSDNSSRTDERLKEVSTQAILYSLVYLNTFFWPFFGLVAGFGLSHEEMQDKKTKAGFYIVQVLYWMLYPLQGFFNFFVYTRLKFKAWRKADPDRSLVSIYHQIMIAKEAPPLSQRRQVRPETKQTNTSSNSAAH
ncbi:expressed unknown protein [Seminavis robusta]|uniref:Uncharacterized protein n=1 Tax=Seminavis robusta TaxID=568900 RepID=A0A9N8HUP1_9STRA|nr:expressed unknown protein [Seminavis robusta]|eukprot:Sro2127_g315760.1 n/a (372) ;mRNA; r:9984-11290